MKRIPLIFLAILAGLVTLQAQVIVFNSEDFTPPPPGNTGGANNWFSDSTYFTSAGYSLRGSVPSGPSGTKSWYMTDSMDFSAWGYVAFSFNQVCKIPPAEQGTIEVSV